MFVFIVYFTKLTGIKYYVTGKLFCFFWLRYNDYKDYKEKGIKYYGIYFLNQFGCKVRLNNTLGSII